MDKRASWTQQALAGIAIYGDRRIVLIAFMGLASGLPLLLTLSTLSYWLRTQGLDLTAIGLFAAVGLPYSLKFLWAPVVDQVRPPLFFARLGQRRGWAVAIQLPLTIAIGALGFTDPATNIAPTAILVTLIAFLSASQDIVIDALRIELLENDEQGAGAAATQAGYRIGLLLAGAGVLALSDVVAWSTAFLALAACMPIGIAAVLCAAEPKRRESSIARDPGAFLRDGVHAPFREFLSRPGVAVILAFVLLYKFGDAIGGTMANPFYSDMGFSGTDIAFVSKTAGLIATMVGVFIGGALVRAIGVIPALAVGGVLQAATNVLFAWVAVAGNDLSVLAIAVWGDNITGGLGAAAFVAYLSALCDRSFTATQYALLTSFMAFGRTLLSTPSGALAEWMGWFDFFIATAFLAVPGLILLFLIARLGSMKPPERAG